MKKFLATILTMGLLASMFTGCTTEKPAETTAPAETATSTPVVSGSEAPMAKGGKKRVAVVCKALDSEFWLDVKSGAEDAGKELGVEVYVTAPDKESNVEGQFRIIEDLIQQDYDALCIAPCDSAGIIPIIEDAVAKGIKVHTVDTDADTDLKSSFIGTDNKAGGMIAGEEMIKIMDGVENPEVAMITGVPGQQTMRDRADGFLEIIAGSELKLVDEQPANSDPGLALTVMENMLTTHPDLDGVFILNATMAVGSLEAVDNAGKTDLKIISFDSSSDALQALKDGKITAIVAQSPYNMGKFAVENAVKELNSEQFEKRVDTGTEMVTKENVDEYIK